MPRFFFDIHDGDFRRDPVGTVLAGGADIRLEAMKALPEIARDAIPKDGDRQAFTVLVRDEEGLTVYTATLTFAGLWLGDAPVPTPEVDG